MASIKKRKNSYQICVSLGYDIRGKQILKYKTYTPKKGLTQKEIKKEVTLFAMQFEDDCKNNIQTTSMKLEEFATDIWYPEYVDKMLSPQTKRYYDYLSKRIYENLGYLRLDKICTRNIQKFVDILVTTKKKNNGADGKQVYSRKTVKAYVSMISNMLSYAVRQGYIKDNPCRNVTLPPVNKKEVETLTQDEVQEMLDLFNKEPIENFKYVVFYTLTLKFGTRRGETLGLEWKDFDFEHNTVHICRDSLFTKELKTYTGKCKTQASVRYIPFDDTVAAMLKVYRMYQEKQKEKYGDVYTDMDRLFTQADGTPMCVSSPNDFMMSFCKRTDMKKVSIHSFRHLNASCLILKGFDIKTVQDYLGHKQASTTLDIYAKAFSEQKARVMNAMKDDYVIDTSLWSDKIQEDSNNLKNCE